MLVNGHDLLNRRIHLLLLAANGESSGQRQRLILGFMNGLNERAHPRHRRIKFTLAVGFFGVPHCREQLLQLLIFNRRQMAVSIHRQNQKLEQRLLLGSGIIRKVNVHVQWELPCG